MQLTERLYWGKLALLSTKKVFIKGHYIQKVKHWVHHRTTQRSERNYEKNVQKCSVIRAEHTGIDSILLLQVLGFEK